MEKETLKIIQKLKDFVKSSRTQRKLTLEEYEALRQLILEGHILFRECEDGDTLTLPPDMFMQYLQDKKEEKKRINQYLEKVKKVLIRLEKGGIPPEK
jgi:hypothetical protein